MGSDGHIRIYDYYKVCKIRNELNKQIPNRQDWLSFPGYILGWTVNNQQACLIYWDCGLGRKETHPKDKGGFEGQWEQELYWYKTYAKEHGGFHKTLLKLFQEFRDRCDKEAILIEDQEVWT